VGRAQDKWASVRGTWYGSDAVRTPLPPPGELAFARRMGQEATEPGRPVGNSLWTRGLLRSSASEFLGGGALCGSACR
jgi:hypothetical protein